VLEPGAGAKPALSTTSPLPGGCWRFTSWTVMGKQEADLFLASRLLVTSLTCNPCERLYAESD